MTHASRLDLQDHVYGFRVSEHVASCPDCRRAADELAAEAESLREAFREAPAVVPPELFARLAAPRPRFTAPALAAAALLLTVLGWLLFQPRTTDIVTPVDATTLSQDAELDRLIVQLKSPSEIRRGIAAAALRKYGGVAVEKLVKAQADPALLEECRGFTAEDQAFYKKAQEPKITIGFDRIPLTDAVGFLSHLSTLRVHISQVDHPETILVTLKLQKASLIEALDRIKADTKIPWGRSSGRTWSSMLVNPEPYTPELILGVEAPVPPSAAPLRLLPRRPWAAALPRNPSKDWPQERLLGALKTLHAAADPALWDFLDSTDPVLRKSAESLLRSLYGAPPEPAPRPLDRILDSRLDLAFENTGIAQILSQVSRSSGLSIVWDPRVAIPDAPITFQVKDLALKNTLKLLASQFSLDFVAGDGWILVTRPDAAPRRARSLAPYWLSVADAGTAETAIDDVLSTDPGRQEKARGLLKETGAAALDWMSYVSLHLEGDLQSRATVELRSLADGLGVWLFDLPRMAKDPAILEKLVTLDAGGRTLEAVMKAEGIPLVYKAPLDQPLIFTVKNLKLGDLLRMLTRPQGLDVYVDGGKVVLDTAANVRTARGEK